MNCTIPDSCQYGDMWDCGAQRCFDRNRLHEAAIALSVLGMVYAMWWCRRPAIQFRGKCAAESEVGHSMLAALVHFMGPVALFAVCLSASVAQQTSSASAYLRRTRLWAGITFAWWILALLLAVPPRESNRRSPKVAPAYPVAGQVTGNSVRHIAV